jgi:mRNA-degrading endonuclease RelE of RelBE toxin-antitoxin system
MQYALDFADGWDAHFNKFDKSVQAKITKKILQLKQPHPSRHMKHGAPFFVEEVGGYRIVFIVIEKEMMKRIEFVGTHKQYEKWYSEL